MYPTVTRHRFTVTDFQRMAETGVLGEDDKVELIDGELIQRAPIGSRHAGTLGKMTRVLGRAVGDSALVWVQNPVVLGEHSEPEPDLMLLRPRDDFYTRAHPRPEEVLLVVEIADTSLAYDREVKLPLYARHGVLEAWLVDLTCGRIEIHQQPAASGYQRILRPERAGVVPLPGLPGIHVDLADLIPA